MDYFVLLKKIMLPPETLNSTQVGVYVKLAEKSFISALLLDFFSVQHGINEYVILH